MVKILEGKPVVAALNAMLRADVEQLKKKGIVPTLAIVRVGERADDIAYERGAANRCKTIGVAVKNFVFSGEIPQAILLDALHQINVDDGIHGCLLLRPLPPHMDDNLIRNQLCAHKDVDGITDGSLAGVMTDKKSGFPPCTPQACLEILDHYNIPIAGKRAVVIGRSLVVGKPAFLMLNQRDATVTLCHKETVDMPAICREADILIAAVGRPAIFGNAYLRAGQVVIDVGINEDSDGKLCGDVNFAEAEPLVAAITPVPGGVGTVTTSVLVKHVVEAAKMHSM
jgi:methylenetetrahydrofolate dehydrogenase (NADP+)/methenyltetrahydrofolate cyclohydrolase